MSATVNEGRADIVRLTKAAVQAAQLGEWDEVIQRYSERGILLASSEVSLAETDELRKMDEQVRDHANTLQALLVELLHEAHVTKQRLQGLRQGLGLSNSTPESVSREA
jgi:hypothetical protein